MEMTRERGRRRQDERTDESSGFSFKCGKLPHFSLYLNFDGNGKSAAHAKGLCSHLQDRRGLLAFVLRALYQANHLLDEREGNTVLLRDVFRGLVALDVGFENGVEDIVGRQRVGIFLVGAQLGRGRLLRMASGMISPLRLTQRQRA